MISGGNYTVERFFNILSKHTFDAVVECGSADGSDALDLLRAYGPKTVYAFEADPNILPRTHRKLDGTETVVLTECALSDEDGETDFWLRPINSSTEGQSSLYPYTRDQLCPLQPVKVNQVRLDTFMRERGIPRIDLLALDAQGGEERILRGLGAKLADVRFVIAEVLINPYYYTCGRTIDSVTAYLNSYGLYEVAQDNFADFANILYARR